jgi:hypothetical protein
MGIEQAPRHGTNLIECSQGVLRPEFMDGTGGGEQSQVAVDLLSRGIGDPPVLLTISPRSAVPFRLSNDPEVTMPPSHT